MNFTKLLMGIIFLAPAYAQSQESWDTTFGVGAGSSYSGIGLNFGVHNDEHTYLGSLGCYSYSESFGSSCGVGIAWQSSMFFNNTNNHATSFYAGIVGSETIVKNNTADDRAIYGGAFGYIYYPNGRKSNGFNIGISFSLGNAKRESDSNTRFQIGYQF